MSRVTSSRREVRRGAALVQMILLLTILLSIMAVTLDGGILLTERRHAQATADAAALAAAADLFKNWNSNAGADTGGTAAASAQTTATANGYNNNGTTNTVTIHIPPTSGDHIGVNGYAEVIVTYKQARLFSSLWGSSTIPISGRAVARGALIAGSASPNNSIGFLVLGTGTNVVAENGNTGIDLPSSATFAVNSTNSPFDAKGNNAEITAGKIVIGATQANDGNPPKLNGTITYNQQTADPLSSLAAPSTTGLVAQSYTGQATMNPGIYTGVIGIGNNTVTMNPGIYYIKPDASGNAGLTVGGNGSLDGTSGVFIYVAPGTGSMTISTGGNATMSLNPINTGTYKGISIDVDRTWPVGNATLELGGTSGANTYGTVYAPTASFTLHGTPNAINGSQVIVNDVSLKGNSSAGVGGGPQAGESIGFQLVE